MKTRQNVTQSILKRIFGKLEIVDAKTPLQVFPTNQDFTQATRRDPYNCGFKRCVSAITHSKAAVVFKEFSYFDHVCEDGVRRIVRYKNSGAVEQAVIKFDTGGRIDICRPFVFLPPSPSMTLTARLKVSRRWTSSDRGSAILGAWHANKALATAKIDLEKARMRLESSEAKASPTSSVVITAKKQVDRMRSRVGKLREIAAEKNEKAAEVRQVPYKRKAVRAQVHNLRVRNGTGYVSHLRDDAL